MNTKRTIRLRRLKALEAIEGAWKSKDHPELRHGAAEWVKKLRGESDRRLQPTR